MPSARAIKARNRKYYKSNAETLGLRTVIAIKIIPNIKRMPHKRVTTLTKTKQREPLVSNIVLIQSPKREPLISNIRLIQSPKREPLVSNIRLIQSPKGERLVSNIVLIQSPKREPLVSSKQYNNHPGRNKAAARVHRALNCDSIP